MIKKSKTFLPAAVLFLMFVSNAFAQISPSLPEPGWAPDGSPVKTHGQLKAALDGGKGVIKGNNGAGSVVTLRGTSFFWASSYEGRMYYNDNVVGWLAHDWRVAVVRAAVGAHTSDGGGEAGYMDGGKTTMITLTETVVEAAIRRGIYVLIDWHMHCRQFSNPSVSVAQTEAGALEFFGTMAQKYGRYPNVLFEVWNEPMDEAGGGRSSCGGNWSDVKTYAEKMVTEIRKHSDNLVLVGSPKWSSQPNQAVNNQVTDSKSNVAYVLHFYAGEHPYSENGGYMQNAKTAVNAGLPVVVTEFGTTNADGGGGGECTQGGTNCYGKSHNAGATDSWISGLESNKIGWIAWSISHKNEGASALSKAGNSGGWNATNDLTVTGKYYRDKIRGYNATAYGNTAYSINVTATEGGKVEKRINNVINNGPYAYGDQVSITAIPDAGYVFEKWSGDASGNNANLTPVAYKVTGSHLNLHASFVKGSMIQNGTFSGTAISPWNKAGTGSEADIVNNELKLTVGSTPGTAHDAHRVSQNGIVFVKGANYKLTFNAYAQSPRAITVNITNGGRNTVIGAAKEVNLTTSKAPYEHTFTATDDTPATPAASSGMLWFGFGGNAATWFLDDVMLECVGNCNGGASALPAAVPGRVSWSVANTAGGITLRGPADAGARVSLYDTRGRLVRSAWAADGMALGSNLSTGSYLLVVKNSAGSEVLRQRVSFVR